MHYLIGSEASYREFSSYFSITRKELNRLKTGKNMYRGEMWDRGLGYLGPLPTENDSNTGNIMLTLKRQFVPRNGIKEVVDRVVDALLGRAPDYKIYNKNQIVSKTLEEAAKRQALKKRLDDANQSLETMLNEAPVAPPTGDPASPPVPEPQGDTEEPEIDENDKKEIEAEVVLSQLWTNAEIAKVLREVVTDFLLLGDAKSRVYPNKNYTRLDKIEDDKILFEATKYIKAEFLEAGNCKIVDDEGEKLSIVKLQRKKGKATEKKVEVSFIDDSGKTYIAVFPENIGSLNISGEEEESFIADEGFADSDIEDSEYENIVNQLKGKANLSSAFTLAGNIVVGEMKGAPFLSDVMLQQNRALNLDLSLGLGVLVESGYEQMVTTNVELDTEIVPDPDRPGKTKEVAKDLKRGPTINNNLIGVQSVDENGTVIYQSPSVMFKPPTPITTFKDGAELYYHQLLAEAKQLFVSISGDATVTGESRIQARQDFVKLVQSYKPELDKFGSWLLTTLLHMTASIADKDGYFEDYEVVFDSKLSAGEMSADEKQLVLNQYQDGLISRESALVLLGMDDPLLEVELIRVDEAEKLDLQVRRLVSARKYSDLLQTDRAETGNPRDSISNRDKNEVNQS